MTPKIKERFVNCLISALTAFGAVILAFALTSSDNKETNLKKELKEKATYQYVDKQDEAIKDDINQYKVDHRELHNQEYNAIQDQLRIIVEWVKEQE